MNLKNILVIQGGMGMWVSWYKLVRAISEYGSRVMGVLSGVALQIALARQLQQGDPEDDIRRILAGFPYQDMVRKIMDEYYIPGGIKKGIPYKQVPRWTVYEPSKLLQTLNVVANYAYVRLAKEGHSNPVCINFLEKMQMPHLSAMAGAMLGGVDAITMGAGIAIQVPVILDKLARNEKVSYGLHVEGDAPVIPDSAGKMVKVGASMSFDPREFYGSRLPILERPDFIPVISSDLLARILLKKCKGRIDGFSIEGPEAGGHNAPPRGAFKLNKEQEPIYSEEDKVDLQTMRSLGLPFWLAGGFGSPQGLKYALDNGATGVQAGTIFALCEESGLTNPLKALIRQLIYEDRLTVLADTRASPTGFPIESAYVPGTLMDSGVYANRPRVCNQHCLEVPYWKQDGTIGYRCSAAPEDEFVAKGGKLESTVGVRCICNGLLSAAGLGNDGEPPFSTLGKITMDVKALMSHAHDTYSARRALMYILGEH